MQFCIYERCNKCEAPLSENIAVRRSQRVAVEPALSLCLADKNGQNQQQGFDPAVTWFHRQSSSILRRKDAHNLYPSSVKNPRAWTKAAH